MIKIIGANSCPDCVEVKYNFDFYKIEYEFIDIQDGIKNLKSFITMRDNDVFYKKAKEKGLIGIPTLLFEDGSKSFYWKKYLEDLGYEPISLNNISCNTKTKQC